MKKVYCLYRVSSKAQLSKNVQANEEDDIPMQKEECRRFIEQHSDWEFYDEESVPDSPSTV